MGIIELLSNPIIGFVGTVGTVLSLLLAVLLYRKGQRDKEPHWAIQTVNLFKDYSGTVAGLDIQYLGEKVRDLSVSKVAFWNRGALTIDAGDLVDGDPLRLETKGKGRILSTKLISTNHKASQPLLSASLERDQAFMRFEYLDRGQGFVLQVIHEGTSSNDLVLKGAIKGAAHIRKIDPSLLLNKSKKERIKEQRASAWTGLGSLAFSALIAWLADTWQWKIAVTSWPLFFVLGVGFCGFALIAFFVMIFQIRRQVPPGLESFYTDPRQLQT